MPLGSRVPERRRKVVTREPGDLPSVVVTREHVGRGVLTEPHRGASGEISFAGDVPQRRARGLVSCSECCRLPKVGRIPEM
jgi:hypothetical protein